MPSKILPMPSKKIPKEILDLAKHIGSLCRAINAVEGFEPVYDERVQKKDLKNLQSLLQVTGESLYIQGVPLNLLNKELVNAGWEQSEFVLKDERVILVNID